MLTYFEQGNISLPIRTLLYDFNTIDFNALANKSDRLNIETSIYQEWLTIFDKKLPIEEIEKNKKGWDPQKVINKNRKQRKCISI